MSFLCERLRDFLRLVAEAEMSRKACLEAPTFWHAVSDTRGVKKRVNVRGVTVQRRLGFPLVMHGEIDTAWDGDDVKGISRD